MTGSCANPAEKAWLERLFATASPTDGVEAALERARERTRQPDTHRHWRQWFAPLACLEGCWLDGVVTVANGHTPLGSALLRLQQALRQWQECPPAAVPDEVSELQVHRRWLLAMAEWGACFIPEAIGLTRAHLSLGGGLFALGRQRDAAAPREALANLFRHWRPSASERRRMASGIRLYRRCTLSWCRSWLAAGGTVAQVKALLRHKAKYGKGYHRHIQLDGRSLDDWLEEIASGNGAALLQALLDSPYLNRKCPDHSLLLRAMDFGGPMFGVFSEAERRLLRRWIARPQEDESLPAGETDPLPAPPPTAEEVASPRTMSNARLYHHLLNPELRSHAIPAARRLVRRVLARSRHHRDYYPWSPVRFRRDIDRRYRQAQGQNFSPWPWLSAEACRWGIEQLAPAILVDGCWLQRSALLSRFQPEIGTTLQRIYRDELGNGAVARHHGNVYRRLLNQAGIELPVFTSPEFIRHPGFVPAAFDLPAYLLAIDAVAEDFLPELLGLNLAIELSGLGEVYQRLAATLEAHGFDATIVRLHQSIDNLAGGHAALARDCIIAYLRRFEPGGQAAVEAQWRRVRHGWQSLRTASRAFARQLILGWAWRFGVAEWIGRPWG